jgi:thioredoxin reductase (NADPH)
MVKNIYVKGTPHKDIEHYDVLILGGGPAGLTAALYAVRYNLDVAVIAKAIGGTARIAGIVENFPGKVGTGFEIVEGFKKQAEQFGAKFLEAEITKVGKDDNGFIIEVDNKEIHGKTLILALGTEHRKLQIEGEKELIGKGVSYCATCDAPLYRHKNVAVVGGADSAAKAALYLCDLAKNVYVIYRRNQMRCEPVLFESLKLKKNVTFYYNAIPLKIKGDKKVKQMEIEINKEGEKIKHETLDVDGVFIMVGADPVNQIVKDLGLEIDDHGYIITDKDSKTNLEGVYAAGDSTNNKLKQMITASAEGAIAAKSAYDYLTFDLMKKKK